VTAQPLAPVIPSSGVRGSRQRSRSAAARRLPLASPVPVPSLPEDVVYGIARIDYITIPAALRRRCGLKAGDQVLLAAHPDRDSLTAYSLAVVDQAIRAHGSFQHLQGGRP
jgi:hypothetical protein